MPGTNMERSPEYILEKKNGAVYYLLCKKERWK